MNDFFDELRADFAKKEKAKQKEILRRKRKTLKIDLSDVHDRTVLLISLGYFLAVILIFAPEVHPIEKTDEVLAICYATFITILTAPFFLYHFYFFIDKQCGNISESDFATIFGFCCLGPVFYGLMVNYILVLNINCSLDKSDNVARYVLVTRTEDKKYFVTDWAKPDSEKCISVKREFSRIAGSGDVMRIYTRSGFLKLEYVNNYNAMKGYPITEFPEDTKFPISEEEFQRIHIKTKPNQTKQK